MAATKSHRVLCEQQRPKAAQVVHTHRTSCGGGWPRGFGELNSSPHSRIFAPVSVGSSPHSYLFTSVTGRIGVHCTKVWHKTYPTCDAPLFEIDRPCAASPRHRKRAATQPFLCVNRRPFWHDFGGGAKSVRYSPVADPGEGPMRAAHPPPPPPRYFYLVSFWWWRKICPV